MVPAYNEATVIAHTLRKISAHMRSLESRYRYEIVVVDDGSTDATADIVDSFAHERGHVRAFHHLVNLGAGQAFKFAFRHCRGDYIVTLDADLTYDVEHIDRLLTRIVESGAKIVVASPYMENGHTSSVPWLRRTLSICANRFLAVAAQCQLSTFTSMVRAYDARFLRSLDLRAHGMEIMPEIIYKARLLDAHIEEIPAHLDWGVLKTTPDRRSSLRLWRHTARVILSGFLFRPVIFFILPGVLMLLFAAYANGWLIAHFIEQFALQSGYQGFFERASAALAAAYAASPHTFIVGIASLMLAIQLMSLGVLALQSRSYFEELFHLASTIYRAGTEAGESDRTLEAGHRRANRVTTWRHDSDTSPEEA